MSQKPLGLTFVLSGSATKGPQKPAAGGTGLNFVLPTTKAAAPVKTEKPPSSRASAPPKEKKEEVLETKRPRAQVDYRALDNSTTAVLPPPGPLRKSSTSAVSPNVPVFASPVSGFVGNGTVAPAANVHKPSKKTAPVAIRTPEAQRKDPPVPAPYSDPVAEAEIVPIVPGVNGPPYTPPFSIDDLLPKRPPPLDEAAVAERDKKLLELSTQIAELDSRITTLTSRDSTLQKHIDEVANTFTKKLQKLRRIQREMEQGKVSKSKSKQAVLQQQAALSAATIAATVPMTDDVFAAAGASSPAISTSKSERKRKKRERAYDDAEYGEPAPVAVGGPQAVRHRSKREVAHLSPVFQKLLRVLEDLCGKNEAYYFLSPVDPVAMNLPDYPLIVKNPIDLGTMQTKIMEQKYATPEELAQDIELMYSNCVLFNGDGTPISGDCNVLRQTFRDKFDRILSSQAKGDRSGGAVKKEAAGSSKQAKKPKKVRDLTWEEKERLVTHIGELPPEQLAQVVQIVAESHHLQGGDAEGAEVELDIAEMSPETLHKLQAVVNAYRRSQGLEVIEEPPEPQPASHRGGDGDEEQQGDEEYKVPAAVSGGGGGAAAAPHSSRRSKNNSRRSRGGAAELDTGPVGPKTHEDLRKLAEETKRNTESALQELKDELKRMAGKVVDKDHKEGDASGALPSVASEYQLLDPEALARKLAEEQDSDESSSSDTVSSEDEDVPHIIAAVPQQTGDDNVVIENAEGWQVDGGASGGFAQPTAGGEGGGESDGKWEAFAKQDARQMEVVQARRELEERLRREREAKEEELRRQEREKRARLEEEERKRREQKDEEEREAQRRREEERLQRKRERENEQQEVVMDEQQRMMQAFERSTKK